MQGRRFTAAGGGSSSSSCRGGRRICSRGGPAACAGLAEARSGVGGAAAEDVVVYAAAAEGAPSSSSRRQVLAAVALAAAAAAVQSPRAASAATAVSAGDWSSPGLAAPEDEAAPKFYKAPNGVRVQELAVGKGPEAQAGDAVLIDFVLRKANGYFIYGTLEGVSFQPKDVPVGPIKLQLGSGEVIEGLETALVGMRQGGKRRVLVPPEVGYVSNVLAPQMPTFATKRQLANASSQPLLFEVELLRVLAS